jgi:hypothetical protein
MQLHSSPSITIPLVPPAQTGMARPPPQDGAFEGKTRPGAAAGGDTGPARESRTAQPPNGVDPGEGTRASGAPDAGDPARQRQEAQVLRQLRARDREVRAHEAAHAAAGGQHVVAGPRFDFQRGPDGRLYAVGGSVQLDTSPVPGDPRATLEKAEQIRRAALAPAQPSGQDRRVAADATRLAAQARMAIARERLEEDGGAGADPGGTPQGRDATSPDGPAETSEEGKAKGSPAPPAAALERRLRATGATEDALTRPEGLDLRA